MCEKNRHLKVSVKGLEYYFTYWSQDLQAAAWEGRAVKVSGTFKRKFTHYWWATAPYVSHWKPVKLFSFNWLKAKKVDKGINELYIMNKVAMFFLVNLPFYKKGSSNPIQCIATDTDHELRPRQQLHSWGCLVTSVKYLQTWEIEPMIWFWAEKM